MTNAVLRVVADFDGPADDFSRRGAPVDLSGGHHDAATGSISSAPSFLTLLTRVLTGHHFMSCEG